MKKSCSLFKSYRLLDRIFSSLNVFRSCYTTSSYRVILNEVDETITISVPYSSCIAFALDVLNETTLCVVSISRSEIVCRN